MSLRRDKRKNAYALSRELRRRLYKGVAFATLAYVALSLVRFHGRFPYLPYELAIIWAVSLLCYASLKEVFRWNDVGDEEVYHGELWAGLVLAGAAWMIAWNIGRSWIFNLPANPFPEDYGAATAETIVLYTLSIISSFLYKYKRTTRQPVRQKTHVKIIRHGQKPLAAVKNGFTGAEPVFTPTTTGKPAQNPNVEVVLTKAPAPDDKNPPTRKNS